jgi:hypothetical protein
MKYNIGKIIIWLFIILFFMLVSAFGSFFGFIFHFYFIFILILFSTINNMYCFTCSSLLLLVELKCVSVVIWKILITITYRLINFIPITINFYS